MLLVRVIINMEDSSWDLFFLGIIPQEILVQSHMSLSSILLESYVEFHSMYYLGALHPWKWFWAAEYQLLTVIKSQRFHLKDWKKRKLDLSENTANLHWKEMASTANPLSAGQLANWQLGQSTQTEKSNFGNPLQWILWSQDMEHLWSYLVFCLNAKYEGIDSLQ